MKKIFAVLAVAVVSSTAFAQGANTPRIDHRQAVQEQRIQKGVASGQINQREEARLERGQQHVANVESRAKADGVVTAKERKHIRHAENVESRRINRQAHDKR